jgi:hypothetical protein
MLNLISKKNDVVTNIDIRDKILGIESIMFMRKDIQIEVPVTHYFSTGVYAREIFIPKGSLIVGKIHKYDQINIISQGDISVVTEQGPMRIKAPYTVISPAGTKRIAYVNEDTVWTTIHPNPKDEENLDKLEDILIAKSFEDFEKFQLDCKTSLLKEIN